MPGPNRFAIVLMAAVLAWGGTPVARAHSLANGTVEVRHPWTSATQQSVAIVSMKLRNLSGQPERLLSATAAVAAQTVIVLDAQAAPETGSAGGATLLAIAVPAHSAVHLKAAGLHIRLEGLKRPLGAYDRFAMTLVFERSGPLDIEVMVEDVDAE